MSRTARAALTGTLFALLVLATVLSRPARAHPSPPTIATLERTATGARLELDIPLAAWALARGERSRAADSAAALAWLADDHPARNELAAAASSRVRATAGPTGPEWIVEVRAVAGHLAPDGPRAKVGLSLRAPAGAADGPMTLRDGTVSHRVVTHTTLVYLDTDASGPGAPQLVGALRGPDGALTLAGPPSIGQALLGAIALGVEHIRSGLDHLLFLLALALVAPLAARDGRWQVRPRARDTLIALAWVVSAFTVGHSLTLALAVLGGLSLGGPVVEAGIALTVAISAAHAARPVFPRHEALVAGLFGLVHGLGLAGALEGGAITGGRLAMTLLGFNLGLELAQLALLALTVPRLLLLTRSRAFHLARLAAAALTGALAIGWLVERVAGAPNPAAGLLEWIAARPSLLLVALATLAIAARVLWPAGLRDPGEAGLVTQSPEP